MLGEAAGHTGRHVARGALLGWLQARVMHRLHGSCLRGASTACTPCPGKRFGSCQHAPAMSEPWAHLLQPAQAPAAASHPISHLCPHQQQAPLSGPLTKTPPSPDHGPHCSPPPPHTFCRHTALGISESLFDSDPPTRRPHSPDHGPHCSHPPSHSPQAHSPGRPGHQRADAPSAGLPGGDQPPQCSCGQHLQPRSWDQLGSGPVPGRHAGPHWGQCLQTGWGGVPAEPPSQHPGRGCPQQSVPAEPAGGGQPAALCRWLPDVRARRPGHAGCVCGELHGTVPDAGHAELSSVHGSLSMWDMPEAACTPSLV